MARVVDHIPEPAQQMVRYWGYYANAARGKRREAEQGEDANQTPSPGRDGVWVSPAGKALARDRPVPVS